jgi:toxin ParE1/3/4
MAGWGIRFSERAEQDLMDILAWTTVQFSSQQAEVYAETLALALEALTEGPEVAGAKSRDDILAGVHVLHVARQGRRGRHFIVFRAGMGRYIDVLRILHESMDFGRHIES